MKIDEISSIIKQRLSDFEVHATLKSEGKIVNIADGVVNIYGLSAAQYGEKLEFADGTAALVMTLERDYVGAVLLQESPKLREGQMAKCTGKVLEVPVGNGLLGRVVNALGEPIDGKGELKCSEFCPVERPAPGIIDRETVNQPLHTGIKAIDSMFAIGMGQRELILGDRQTGKTSIALDTIINQKNSGVKCIYVAIGQKTSSVAAIAKLLEEHGAMSYTTIVAATAADNAAQQYIAPYAGSAMGEFFRDHGENALIVYDDLTKHAWAYRQISLLLKRPPGREAYPGDVFYLHSRLLERSARVNAKYVAMRTNNAVKAKTGSLSALPIIETQGGDISSFIPTNVISITDGQIFLTADLFNSGIKPAIDVGLSVSRVGSEAQSKIIRKLGGGLRLALAQYRDLSAFAAFSADLDASSKKILAYGTSLMAIMKQNRFAPLDEAHMAISIFAVEKGYLDALSQEQLQNFEASLHSYMSIAHVELINKLNNHEQDYSPELDEELHAALKDFKATHHMYTRSN